MVAISEVRVASIDRTVKAAETVGAAACGYDSGKKIKGQKRHIATDTLGLVLCVLVTSAAVQDRDGAHSLLAPPGPRTDRRAGSRTLGRPAATTGADQPRPTRQDPGTSRGPALARLARQRTGRHPRDRQRQQLPRQALPVVPPGLHPQDRTRPLRPHPHEHLSLRQQPLKSHQYLEKSERQPRSPGPGARETQEAQLNSRVIS
ncbi:transposase [Nonomuraea glycinis]|uniref:transposase n=1 Tax=Nonomuraea glycinis TaxID=2047744 RepID=UPI00389B3673